MSIRGTNIFRLNVKQRALREKLSLLNDDGRTELISLRLYRMTSTHFVGRFETIERLRAVLNGQTRADGNLTVQSIEGPGGIGKTFLLNHVVTTTPLAGRQYLQLRIDGNDLSAASLIRAVSRMIDSADAEASRRHLDRSCFPEVTRVIEAIEAIRSEALAEFEQHSPADKEGREAFSRFLDVAFTVGKHINDIIPAHRTICEGQGVGKTSRNNPSALPIMQSLREETVGFFERLGLGSETALRNSLKGNACRPFAEALLSDLSAILAGYRAEDWYLPTRSKIEGIDRLLLILDDYEKLQASIGEFVVSYLLPALRSARFESVVIILGRDQLQATHPAWDQHLRPMLLPRIELEPLSRQDMEALVESYGVHSPGEKERAWQDTQGYPFYVQLWIEEVKSGGRSAVMLKRFYDRTTRWMSDKEKEWLHLTLFLEEVNKRSLRSMVENGEEADAAFRWFEREGSVRDTVGGVFRVREYLRSRLSDYLRISDPDLYEQLERKGRSLATR